MDLEREVKPDELGSYSDYSLYDGQTLKGWPVLTMVRGEVVMRDGETYSEEIAESPTHYISGESNFGRFNKKLKEISSINFH